MSFYRFGGAYFMQHMGSFNYGKIRTMGAVLVAISIPIFTSQLEKSRDAVTVSNLRAAYAEASADFLTDASNGTGKTITKKVVFKGTQKNEFSGLANELPFTVTTDLQNLDGTAGEKEINFTFDGSGKVTVAPKA